MQYSNKNKKCLKTTILLSSSLHNSAKPLSSSSLTAVTKSLIWVAIAVWYCTDGISVGFTAVVLTPKTVSTVTEFSCTSSASRTVSKLETFLCSISDCFDRYSFSSRLSSAKKQNINV